MGGNSKAAGFFALSIVLFAVGFSVLFGVSDNSLTGAVVGLAEDDLSESAGAFEDNSSVFNETETLANESSLNLSLSEEESSEEKQGALGIAAIEDSEEVSGATSSCQDINTSVTLTGNVAATGNCFNITASNVVFDGAGYNITGDGSGEAIITTEAYSNITLINFTNISGFGGTAINLKYILENITLADAGIEGSVSFWYSAGGNFYNLNITSGGIYALDINDTIIYDSNISSPPAHALDLIGTNDNITSQNNHYWDVSQSTYRLSSTTTNSLFEEDLFTDINVGVQSQSTNSVFRNLNIVGATGRSFFDQSDNVDTIVYNNSYGFVQWNLTRTTINFPGELKVGEPVAISEEIITFDEDAVYSALDDEAVIEFYGLAYDDVQLYRNGVRCDDDPVFCNVSYSGGVLTANVSDMANFTLTEVSSNTNPTLDTLVFNATDSLANLTFDDFHCYVFGIDNESSNMTAQIEIYNASTLYYSVNQTVDNSTLSSVYTLDNATTSSGENWVCGVSLVDESSGESAWQNSSVSIESCGTLTKNYTFTQTISSDDNCFELGVDGLSLDMNGKEILGDGIGDAFYGTGLSSFLLHSGTVNNFSSAINVSSSTGLNITNVTFSNSTYAFTYSDVNDSFVTDSYILSNTLGFQFINSYYNLIYNNNLNSTTNADVLTENFWNTSYSCSDSYENIIGGNCTGGNYWSDYTGIDNGNGSEYPWNLSQDQIGDQDIPWNSSTNIAVDGDYLPLVTVCPESWSCSAWSTCSSSSQSRTCTDANACGTTTSRPALVQSCSSGGSSSGGGGGGGGSSSSSSDSESSEESSSESSEDSSLEESSPEIESEVIVESVEDQDSESDSLTESDDGGVELPEPAADVYSSTKQISDALQVGETTVEDVVSEIDSDSQRDETSESANLVGFAGFGGTNEVESKPAPAKVDDAQSAKEAVNVVKKKISLNLENDGVKKIQLKPQVSGTGQDTKLIVTRKTYSGAASKTSGIEISKSAVSGDLLRASLTNTELVEIAPGEKVDVEIEVAAGFSLDSQIPVKIELLSYDGLVYEEELIIDQEPTLASAVVPNTDTNVLDLYAMIVDKSELTFVEEEASNSLTGAAVSDLVFDSFVSNEDYYLEFTVLSENEGLFNQLPVLEWFVPNKQVVFAELYGPYPIESQEGFVFAQQFSYDPELYPAGDYIIQMRIMQGLHELSLQEFEVYLE